MIDELQSTEGGEIPTVIDGESLEEQVYVPWTVHTRKPKVETPVPGQITLFQYAEALQNGAKELHEEPGEYQTGTSVQGSQPQPSGVVSQKPEDNTEKDPSKGNDNPESQNPVPVHPQQEPLPVVKVPVKQQPENDSPRKPSGDGQLSFIPMLDRESVIRFINESGFLTYVVRSVKINSYLKSLLSLAGLLTQNLIYPNANDEVKDEVTDLIRKYILGLHKDGKYDELVKQVMEFKLSIQIFDVFGEAIKNYYVNDLFATTETDLDRQLRAADAKMGGYGFPFVYGRRFLDFDNPNAFKMDCILFAADEECMRQLNTYAEKKFHDLNDQYRKYVVSKSERCRKQYSDIIADGDVVSKHNFTLPETISAKVESGGKHYQDHLFANEDGVATIRLNSWETAVLEEEQKRTDFVCWLRNPSRQSWSLCIPYEMEGSTKATYPDFIIIRKDPELDYVMDILEPHNPDFKDNLGKAKGFALYANEEPRIGRIQLIRMSKDAAGNNRFKRLDMAKGAIRTKVLAAVNNDELDHIFDTDGVFQD